MIIYGSKQCTDTIDCLSKLNQTGEQYDFRDLSDLAVLKDFLSYRDFLPLFESVKARGGVGIPFMINEDGTMSLG